VLGIECSYFLSWEYKLLSRVSLRVRIQYDFSPAQTCVLHLALAERWSAACKSCFHLNARLCLWKHRPVCKYGGCKKCPSQPMMKERPRCCWCRRRGYRCEVRMWRLDSNGKAPER
jgi:hypothetical protein